MPSGSAQRPTSTELHSVSVAGNVLRAHARDAGARDGRHDAGLRVDAAHSEAVLLANVHVVVGVEAQGVGHQGAGFGGRPPVAVGGSLAGAEHRGDDAGLHVDLADAVVRVVADV